MSRAAPSGGHRGQSPPAQPRRTWSEIRRYDQQVVKWWSFPRRHADENTKYYVNPTGRFVKGGPAADPGLTGRKVIVDNIRRQRPPRGGCFSGQGRPPRWTAPRPTPPGGWPRTLWRRPSRAASGAGLRHRRGPAVSSWWRLRHRNRGRRQGWRRHVRSVLTLRPPPSSGTGICAGPSTVSCGLRPHGPGGPGRDLGEDRPGGGVKGRRGAC